MNHHFSARLQERLDVHEGTFEQMHKGCPDKLPEKEKHKEDPQYRYCECGAKLGAKEKDKCYNCKKKAKYKYWKKKKAEKEDAKKICK